MHKTIDALEAAYLEAAANYRSALAGLVNYAAELSAYIAAREELSQHPSFSGLLPFTYFSGGDLDPHDERMSAVRNAGCAMTADGRRFVRREGGTWSDGELTFDGIEGMYDTYYGDIHIPQD